MSSVLKNTGSVLINSPLYYPLLGFGAACLTQAFINYRKSNHNVKECIKKVENYALSGFGISALLAGSLLAYRNCYQWGGLGLINPYRCVSNIGSLALTGVSILPTSYFIIQALAEGKELKNKNDKINIEHLENERIGIYFGCGTALLLGLYAAHYFG